MKNYDQIEEEAHQTKKKRTKVKVSGKSVFLLQRAAQKTKKK